MTTYIPCQERIEIPDTHGTACTYCMRPRGHADEDGKGGHNIVDAPPKEEKKNAKKD